MPQTHEYPVSVSWSGGRDGSGAFKLAHSGFEGPIAVPVEYQGTGAGTNPEELLTSAVACCYGITFGIIAANRKLVLKDFKVDAVGEVEQNGASLIYTAITIRPTIVLEASASDEIKALAEDLAHKADLYCIITNAVRGKVAISVEPKITRG